MKSWWITESSSIFDNEFIFDNQTMTKILIITKCSKLQFEVTPKHFSHILSTETKMACINSNASVNLSQDLLWGGCGHINRAHWNPSIIKNPQIVRSKGEFWSVGLHLNVYCLSVIHSCVLLVWWTIMRAYFEEIHSHLLTVKGVLHPLPQKAQKLTCFVLYLKITNIFLKNDICIL